MFLCGSNLEPADGRNRKLLDYVEATSRMCPVVLQQLSTKAKIANFFVVGIPDNHVHRRYRAVCNKREGMLHFSASAVWIQENIAEFDSFSG